MSVQSVKKQLSAFNLENEILTFDQSSATVELAAQALGCEPERIAKTLSFLVMDEPVIIVTAGDQKVDNRKYRNTFQAKAKMIPAPLVEEYTTHEVGGVCPFGLPDGTRIYLDSSLKRFKTVYPACGSHNNAIELSCDQLENITGAEWVDVCKPIG